MHFIKANDNMGLIQPQQSTNRKWKKRAVFLIDLLSAALIVFGPFIASWTYFYFTGKPLEF